MYQSASACEKGLKQKDSKSYVLPIQFDPYHTLLIDKKKLFHPSHLHMYFVVSASEDF